MSLDQVVQEAEAQKVSKDDLASEMAKKIFGGNINQETLSSLSAARPALSNRIDRHMVQP